MIREVMFYDFTSVGSVGLSCTVGMYMLSAAQDCLMCMYSDK